MRLPYSTMWQLALVIVLFVSLEGKTVHESAKTQSKILLQSRHERQCDVRILSTDEARLKCESRDGNYVPNAKRCMFIPKTLDRTLWARCELGVWVSIEVQDGRFKRSFDGGNALEGAAAGASVGSYFGPIGTGVGAVLGGLFCGFFCSKEPVYVVKKAPRYSSSCPPSDIESEYFASEGTRERTVTWTPPKASDEDGSIASDAQTSTPLRGESFKGSVGGTRHTVRYEAKDNDGMSAYCFFTFTVTVRACSEIPRLRNGYKVCDEGNIYGSVCSFYCDEGYVRSGSSTAKCRQDGTWSGTASCAKKRCGEPDEPLNGTVSCLNPHYEYQSICSIHCNTGFILEGSVFMQCQADQTWSVAEQPRCIDAEPPMIDCLTPQIFYADRGVLTASSVVWEEPRARDTVDPDPVIKHTDGPQPGATLVEESTYVSYVATDASGNVSPECSIELRLEPITCGHPADTLTDNKLMFNCSESLYYYGVSCDLSCDYNLPLEGVDTVTCETNPSDDEPVGEWDWGSGAEPYCREIECPPLDAPINGALVQESVNLRPVVIQMCNENYDIPSGFDNYQGQIYCYDSGNWHPLTEVPDCIKSFNPRRMRLPSELYYYSGDCSDEATLEQIKQQFLTIITNEAQPLFHSICPKDLSCTVDSVTVTCGPVSSRRKRRSYIHHIEKRAETHATVFAFDLSTEWKPGNMTTDDAYDYTDGLQAQQKAVIESLVAENKLDLPGYALRDDSLQFASKTGWLTCDEPHLRFDGEKCTPCPRGHFMTTDKKCQHCPIGEYMDTDGTTSCKKCPEGKSTEKTGSKSLTNCTDICSAGSYSKKGLAPCSLCPVGTYQESDGMIGCNPCLSGQTTATQGSTSQSACQSFDVLLRNTVQDVSLGTISAVENLSILFWAKLFSVGTASATSLKLRDDSAGTILTINLAPEISVQAGDTFLEAAVILSDTKWDHLAVVWNRGMASVQLYVDGELKNAETVSLPSLTNGSITVHSTASEGVYLTGLQIVDKILKGEEISPLLTSCTENLEQPIFSMVSFLGKSTSAINIITPAICDAIDECSSSPCGEHLCVNEIGNFSCICSQGMTGRFCDIPRDYCIGNECKNGATCIKQVADYTCSCLEGYSGSFCEIPPVDGGWSEYGEWSSCSVSCDQGTRTRGRSCDNPPPGVGGQACSGSYVETEVCNQATCNECDDAPRRGYGITPNCSTNPDTGIRECNPYCRDGTFMQPGVEKYETYTCGPNTNYLWTPFDRFPECVADGHVDRPNRYRLESSVEYETNIPSSSASDVESKIENELSRTDCVNKGLCKLSVSLDNGGSKRKRTTGSILQIIFDIVPGSNDELKLDDYVTSGNVSAGLQELVDAIVSLELTAADLQANASAYFNVDSGGVMYSMDDATLTINGIIDCSAGSVSDDGVCVECPVGTKEESNSCVYCDVGYYQDENGQTVCKQCPTGSSTPILGAREVSECIVSVTTTASTVTGDISVSSTRPDDSDEEDEGSEDDGKMPNKAGAIAGIAIGSFAVVLAIIAIVLVFYKKHAKWNRKVHQRGSFASLNMVGPAANSRLCSGATNASIGDNTAISRFTLTEHIQVTSKEPMPPVFPTKPCADALKKELGEYDPTMRYTATPPRTTCFTPPPPYTENP